MSEPEDESTKHCCHRHCFCCPPKPALCPDCGKPDGSFACKIRHVQLNTGDAKAARD